MKICLDENLPVELKKEFSETSYLVYSVKDLNWVGIKNGELLNNLVMNESLTRKYMNINFLKNSKCKTNQINQFNQMNQRFRHLFSFQIEN